jgi:hypothetical protein
MAFFYKRPKALCPACGKKISESGPDRRLRWHKDRGSPPKPCPAWGYRPSTYRWYVRTMLSIPQEAELLKLIPESLRSEYQESAQCLYALAGDCLRIGDIYGQLRWEEAAREKAREERIVRALWRARRRRTA